MSDSQNNNLELERDYYKFYKEMYEERYRKWRMVAVSLLATLAYITGFVVTYYLLSK